MHTTPILPANIKGNAGAKIQTIYDWVKHTDGRFQSGIPGFQHLVLTSANADGDHIPEIGYVGHRSHIKEVMEGQYGRDVAAAIRHCDPRFDQAVAIGFARAAGGDIVSEHMEMDVTPPGALKPIPWSWYRFICKIRIGDTPMLLNLTLPTPDQIHRHLSVPDKEYRRVC